MINDILLYLASGEALTVADIAKKMDVTVQMVLQVLEDLKRMGYLEERALVEAPSCSSGCGSCSGCAITPTSEGVRLHLTTKGVSKLQRIQNNV